MFKMKSPWHVVGIRLNFGEWMDQGTRNEHSPCEDFRAEEWTAARPPLPHVKVSKWSGPGRAHTWEKGGSLEDGPPRCGLHTQGLARGRSFPTRVFELNSYRKERVSPSPRGSWWQAHRVLTQQYL